MENLRGERNAAAVRDVATWLRLVALGLGQRIGSYRRIVFGNEGFERPDDAVVVLLPGALEQVGDAATQLIAIHRDVFPDTDFRVPRALHVFAFDAQFFEELLAGTRTGEDDLDVLARAEAAEDDQFLGETIEL